MLFNSSDETLIDKALRGSGNSWSRLVKRYERLVFNYCLRMCGQRSDALDLMQEIFLTAFRSLPSYRGEGQFKSWIMRIAVNKCTDFFRGCQRNPLFNGSAEPLEGQVDAATPEQSLHIHRIRQHILSSMQKLPPEQRQVVELKFFQQLTFEDISHLTGVSTNTLKTRLYAALAKLRTHVEVQNVL